MIRVRSVLISTAFCCETIAAVPLCAPAATISSTADRPWLAAMVACSMRSSIFDLTWRATSCGIRGNAPDGSAILLLLLYAGAPGRGIIESLSALFGSCHFTIYQRHPNIKFPLLSQLHQWLHCPAQRAIGPSVAGPGDRNSPRSVHA